MASKKKNTDLATTANADKTNAGNLDIGDKPFSISEIKRPKTVKTAVPAEGLYLGSGVYPHGDKIGCTGLAFSYWMPLHPTLDEVVALCKEANQGNTLQFWQNNETLMKIAKEAAAAGIYMTCLYSNASPDQAKTLSKYGALYLGYDFGERYVFSLYSGGMSADRGMTREEASRITLRQIADGLMRRVQKDVKQRHKDGWGNLMITSGNFALDYEIAAGVEIPCTEDYAFGSLMVASALSRGLYRQYDLPMWGSHLAHEWYSWIPHANPMKMPSFELGLYLKYMSGSKMIINESGNWALQSSLCPDSPMHTMPRVPGDPPGLYSVTEENKARYSDPYIEEARRLYCNIDYRSPVARKYREIISDFYDFCKEYPAPKGQPEASIALAKGNFDLAGFGFHRPSAVAGAYGVAETDANWMHGDPEASWDIAEKVFYPRPPVLKPNNNRLFAGTPHGQVDIVSFAYDNITADFLSRNYKCLIFTGWNTCSDKQYGILCDYVKGGGRLVISIPHLSRNEKRNYNFFKKEELVNEGDFSELCGLKVTGKGARFYWATGNTTEKNCLGLYCPRRYGIMAVPLGELEYTNDASCYEALAADDERFRPVILRCKQGKGEVFFVNTWAYPAAVNADDGAGAVEGSKGLMGLLYDYVARISRGHVWITGDDLETPDEDCEHIVVSYFPDEGKVYLQNIDFRNPRKCVLHQFGDKDFLELEPGEFRVVESVVLEPFEKQNGE